MIPLSSTQPTATLKIIAPPPLYILPSTTFQEMDLTYTSLPRPLPPSLSLSSPHPPRPLFPSHPLLPPCPPPFASSLPPLPTSRSPPLPLLLPSCPSPPLSPSSPPPPRWIPALSRASFCHSEHLPFYYWHSSMPSAVSASEFLRPLA